MKPTTMMGATRTLLLFALSRTAFAFVSTIPRHAHHELGLSPEYAEAPDDDNNSGDTQQRELEQEYVAIGPGCVVKIEVGDFNLARKAQKKRRRSESPLLVPCSIISVQTQSAFRWNLLYILRKTGKAEIRHLINAYKRTFCWKPTMWARLLGLDEEQSSGKFLDVLFPPLVQEAHGVALTEKSLELVYPKSPKKAAKLAKQSALLSFRQNSTDTAHLLHTGHVLFSHNGQTTTKPLSTALRIHQDDETIEQGDSLYAVVSEFNEAGDGGEPLLKLSLNPNTVFRPAQRTDTRYKYNIEDLKVGDVLSGKVAKFIRNGALIDCGVGRKGSIPIFGRLHFRDAKRVGEEITRRSHWSSNKSRGGQSSSESKTLTIENAMLSDDDESNDDDIGEEDDEEELRVRSIEDLFSVLEEEENAGGEDITEFFTQNDDGSLTYKDPETGESQRIDISGDDEDDEDIDEDDEEEETEEEFVEANSAPEEEMLEKHAPKKRFSYEKVQVKLGDQLKVYVKSVSAHSSQLAYTLDQSVCEMKSKDIKKETEKNKKLERLAKQLGGFASIRKLKGTKSQGIVKATSKAGDWMYVQPQDKSLPVGVATAPASLQIHEGDSVSIQFAGVDEVRGQLALRVLNKLEP